MFEAPSLVHGFVQEGPAATDLRHLAQPQPSRDRTFENQSFRASGLSLVTAAIVHWNTTYLDLAVRRLRATGLTVPDELLAHVAPLGWEHISLTGDYDWAAAFTAARRLPATPRYSRRVPGLRRLACSFAQAVQ